MMWGWLVIVFVIVWSGTALAQSEPPVVRLGDYGQSHYPQGTDGQQYPDAEKRGTEAFPIIIQMAPTSLSEEERARKEADEHKKTAAESEKIIIDRIIAAATVGLAVFTVGLMIYTARLFRATKRLVDDAKENETRHAVDRQVALATAGTQTTVMSQQADILEKQKEIAREGFIAAHRPRLTVRFINCPEPIIDAQPTADLRVANTGASDANYFSIGADIFRRTNNRIVPGGWSAIPQTVPLNPVVEPSQELTFTVIGKDTLNENHVKYVVEHRSDELCLIGIIVYEDRNGTKRTTSFFRKYNPDQRRYMRVSPHDAHADYEYEN